MRRLLSRGTKVRRKVDAVLPQSSPIPRPRRLTLVQSKAYGIETEALLDSGAVPNLISEKLCNELQVKFEHKPIGPTVADGHKARFLGVISDVPISFDDLHISMEFFIMDNPPFDIIIAVPTLEALRGCLDFGLKQVTLFAGDKLSITQ